MNFNQQIKAALKKQGISHYRLCKNLGIDQGQFSRFLRNNDNLSTSNLQKIFDYLGIGLIAG